MSPDNPNVHSESAAPEPDFKTTLSPTTWNKETLLRNWAEHLLATAESTNIPYKRLSLEVQQDPTYQEAVEKWDSMESTERMAAWKRLLAITERQAADILPSCVQCGECCRKGSPTLLMDDLDLLREEKIPWDRIITLRRGEPVHSPYKEKLVFLLDERIKFREKPQTRQCVFLDDGSSLCAIYVDRPVQCRAQACWDPKPAKELAEQPHLTRKDIFGRVDVLMDLLTEHDRKCAFQKLDAAFKRLEETHGESVDEVLQLLAYEDHFRRFLAEQLNIPETTLDLVFGRSFEELVSLFGFEVRREADGAKCLVPSDPAAPDGVEPDAHGPDEYGTDSHAEHTD